MEGGIGHCWVRHAWVGAGGVEGVMVWGAGRGVGGWGEVWGSGGAANGRAGGVGGRVGEVRGSGGGGGGVVGCGGGVVGEVKVRGGGGGGVVRCGGGGEVWAGRGVEAGQGSQGRREARGEAIEEQREWF